MLSADSVFISKIYAIIADTNPSLKGTKLRFIHKCDYFFQSYIHEDFFKISDVKVVFFFFF